MDKNISIIKFISLQKNIMKNIFVLSKWKRYTLFYLYTYILSLVTSFFIDYISFIHEVYNFEFYPYFVVNLIAFFLLSFINLFIVEFFNRKYKWKENIKRITLEILAAVISINIITHIVGIALGLIQGLLAIGSIILNSVQNIIIIILLELIYTFIKLKEDKIRIQELQIENEKFKYNLLRNQLNPHFLFNSLNTLSAMVYTKTPNESVDYIEKLSDFYRYVLINDRKNLISLKEEIEIINKYGDILKTRFQDGFVLNINLKEEDINKKILFMSLQLLVENAVKHNIASKENPLIINIYSENNFIVVSNNKVIRTGNIVSTGIGLDNLNERYKIVDNKEIKIIDDKEKFTVKIPMI